MKGNSDHSNDSSSTTGTNARVSELDFLLCQINALTSAEMEMHSVHSKTRTVLSIFYFFHDSNKDTITQQMKCYCKLAAVFARHVRAVHVSCVVLDENGLVGNDTLLIKSL